MSYVLSDERTCAMRALGALNLQGPGSECGPSLCTVVFLCLWDRVAL